MNLPAYNSSKSAVNGLTVAFAKALAARGITVTSICPGWVRTDIGTTAALTVRLTSGSSGFECFERRRLIRIVPAA